MDTGWRIELLGGLRATAGDRIITRFQTQKAAVLLAYLAYYPERPHPRERLIELLWPDDDLDVGRHKLSVALSSLRQQLEPPGTAPGSLLSATRFAVGLVSAALTTDVAEFEAALTAAGAAAGTPDTIPLLAQAVEIYRGELLPGYYDEWILAEQQRLEALFLQSLRRLTELIEQAGEIDRALSYALRAVRADPLREDAHRVLIRLYAASGQPAAAQRQYRELERILREELDTAPSEATRALMEEIRRSGVPLTTDHRPPTTDNPIREVPNAAREGSGRSSVVGGRPFTPSPPHPFTPSSSLEPAGGAMPLESEFYVVRRTDEEFRAALARWDSIVLLKGPRQVGKTSLLARGLQQAREAGARTVLTDVESFNAEHLASAETLLLALAQSLADQLDLDVMPVNVWEAHRGPNPNLRRYLQRHVLTAVPGPLIWALDEVDRLFACPFGSEIFGLFRSWHNERALDPAGPWSRLTLAVGYATEAHLFITDLNKSPFNVGTRLTLEDFTREQVAELNRRYGSPLPDEADLARCYDLVGGHPYLVGRGLHEMAARGIRITDLAARAGDSDGIFGDHLRRLTLALKRDSDLCDVVRQILQGRPCPTPEAFYRLRTAGVLTGDSERDVRFRCRLYTTYLEHHLL